MILDAAAPGIENLGDGQLFIIIAVGVIVLSIIGIIIYFSTKGKRRKKWEK